MSPIPRINPSQNNTGSNSGSTKNIGYEPLMVQVPAGPFLDGKL